MNRLAFILLGFIAFVIAVATVVEKVLGTEVALEQVYTSSWLCALWAVMAVAAVVRCLQVRMWRRPSLLLLHAAFLVILCGALLTHLTSVRGYVHLRDGETTRFFSNPSGESRPLPFYLCLDSFQVEMGETADVPRDYISHVMFHDAGGDVHTSISMNRPAVCRHFRIFQTSYDDDLHGSIFTVTYDPWGIGVTYAGYALLAVGMVWHSLRRRTQLRATGREAVLPTFVGVALGVVFACYMLVGLLGRPLMPVLRSPMLFVHVGTIMVSYCLLVASFFTRRMLRPAVCTLAAGIFLGAMWANISWGTYWSWDPKEAWALVTLIVYAIPLHTRSLTWFRSTTHYRIYMLLAFACLLMTYFGVNWLLGGMHAYLD